MILEVPLQPTPNQTLSIDLNGQNAEISVRQIGNAMMASLWIDDEVVFENSICGHMAPLGQFDSVLFSGVLVFVDQLDTLDPIWDGLGERFKLFYVSEDDDLYRTLARR